MRDLPEHVRRNGTGDDGMTIDVGETINIGRLPGAGRSLGDRSGPL
jgi:hypothetical protein